MTVLLTSRGSHPLFDMPIPPQVTPRQRELIDLLVARRSVAAAATELGISVHTARAHIRSIALRLPNPNGLPALRLIRSYFPERVSR